MGKLYEPGLGCPRCSWKGSTFAGRAKHIESKHPGTPSGPTPEMQYADQRAHDVSWMTAAERDATNVAPSAGLFNDRRGRRDG